MYAEAYKGALHLLDKKPPGYITFVSHAGRDLMNGLARLGIEREQVQYANRLDELQRYWKDEWGASKLHEIDDTESGYLIPYKVCEKIQDLIDEHRTGRLRGSETVGLFFTTFLDYLDRERIPENFVQEWSTTRDWFVKHAHLREGEFEMEVSSEVERHFQTLDGLLYVPASSELERISGINEILEETNE